MAQAKIDPAEVAVSFPSDELLNIHELASRFKRPQKWIRRNIAAPFVKIGEERFYFLSDVHAHLRGLICPGSDGNRESIVSDDQDDPTGSSDGTTGEGSE